MQFTVSKQDLSLTGFEPITSSIGSNRSTNWATTLAGVNLFPVP